jgi:hypothetical protein
MTVMDFSLLLLRQQQSVLVQIYVFPPIFHPPIPSFSVPQYTAPLQSLTLAVLPAPPIGESVREVVVQQVFVVVVVAVAVVAAAAAAVVLVR